MNKTTHKETETIKSLLKNHIKEFYNMCPDLQSNSEIYHSVIMIAEEALIEETLIYTKGIQAKAAKILGINRNTLRKKIEQFEILYNDFE